MSLDAKIVYQYELDELAASSRLEVMPLIAQLFEVNPDARPRDVIFTLELYLQEGNFTSYPTLIQAPFEDVPEEELPEEEIVEVVEPKTKASPSTGTLKQVPVKPNRNRNRTIATRDAGGKVNAELDYRNLMNDINHLEL